MKSLAIVPTGSVELPTFTLSPQFLLDRDDAIAGAALIGRVTNAQENLTAVEAQRGIMSLTREVENARKKIKEPILDLSRRIDATARAAVQPLEVALMPLCDMLSDFAGAERERARVEAERIEAERQTALRAAAELAAAAERAIREEERLRTMAATTRAEEDRIAAEAAAARERAMQQQVRAIEIAGERAAFDTQAHAPARADGQTVRMEWEVTVNDIWALARGHPACVRIEPRLTEIKSLLDLGTKIAGVSAKRVPVVSVRTAHKHIEV
jgi:hypothetical protein